MNRSTGRWRALEILRIALVVLLISVVLLVPLPPAAVALALLLFAKLLMGYFVGILPRPAVVQVRYPSSSRSPPSPSL